MTTQDVGEVLTRNVGWNWQVSYADTAGPVPDVSFNDFKGRTVTLRPQRLSVETAQIREPGRADITYVTVKVSGMKVKKDGTGNIGASASCSWNGCEDKMPEWIDELVRDHVWLRMSLHDARETAR